MAYLINRNPSGRIICLHALLRYLYNKFKDEPFTLTDMKYDADSKYNIHQTCSLLVNLPSVPFPICPYLENPLNKSKCYLTQSVQRDKQKSKSVSDAFNALEGLGFVERPEKGGKITKFGEKFVSVDYYDEKCLNIIKQGLLSYGPFVGLLKEFVNSNGTINKSDIKLGYPTTPETIRYTERLNGERLVRLSTGSQQDTITRTRSVLFIWSVTGGFSIPVGMPVPADRKKWHVEMLPYIKSKKWTKNKFNILIGKNFFKNKIVVSNPLSYLTMTKSTKALRERHQDDVRNLSLKYENIIKNRRFAIVYLLAKCSEKNKKLNFLETINQLRKFPKLFVINTTEFDKIMYVELDIAPVSGVPYDSDGEVLYPLTYVDMDTLCNGAPTPLIQILDDIYPQVVE